MIVLLETRYGYVDCFRVRKSVSTLQYELISHVTRFPLFFLYLQLDEHTLEMSTYSLTQLTSPDSAMTFDKIWRVS